jgi:hypothetical protein
MRFSFRERVVVKLLTVTHKRATSTRMNPVDVADYILLINRKMISRIQRTVNESGTNISLLQIPHVVFLSQIP